MYGRVDEEPLHAPEASWRATSGVPPGRTTKRYCFGKLTRSACFFLFLVIVLLIGIGLFFTIFYGGKAYAQVNLDRTDVTIMMEIKEFREDSLAVHAVATVDNRNTLTASVKQATLKLMYEKQEMGSFVFPACELKGDTITKITVDSDVTVTSKDVFGQFATAALTDSLVPVRLSGQVSASGLGLTFGNLNLEKNLLLEGMGNFSNPSVSVTEVSVVAAAPDRILMSLNATMTNPSGDLSFPNIGFLNFSVYYKGELMGFCTSQGNVSLLFGENHLSFTSAVVRTESNKELVNELFSYFLTGSWVELELHGTYNSTQFTLMKEAMSKLRVPAKLPPLTHHEDKLFQNVYMSVNMDTVFDNLDPENCSFTENNLYLDVSVVAHNPFDVVAVLQNAFFDIQFQGQYLGTGKATGLNQTISARDFAVTPQRICLTDDLNVLLKFINYMKKTLHADTTGTIPFLLFLDINGTSSMELGDYSVDELPYVQRNVLVISRMLETP